VSSRRALLTLVAHGMLCTSQARTSALMSGSCGCDVHDVPCATNLSGARLMLTGLADLQDGRQAG